MLSLRPLTRSLPLLRPCSLRLRSFHPSLPSRANPADYDSAFLRSPEFTNSPIYEKLRGNEGALEAIKKVGVLFQEKGIDMTQKPSTFTMAKLAMDGEIRAAISEVLKEFQKAGIEITPDSLSSMFPSSPETKK